MDHVDLFVVRDGLQRDVRDPLVDKPFLDVAIKMSPLPLGEGWGEGADGLSLFFRAFRRIGQQVVGILRGHQTRAGQRKRHTARVAGNPAASPLLGDVGRRAAAACRIEHEIARIGSHEEGAF
jgi:hypothetical protein